MSDDRLTIRLPLHVRQRLTALADEQNTTVSALVRRAAERLAEGAPELSLQAPLAERELAAVRVMDREIVERVERTVARARRRYVYARLRSALRTRELQASLEPEL